MGEEVIMYKPFIKHIQGHSCKVNPQYVLSMSKDIVFQFHRFPGTNSVVCHASIDGFELAIASSPCIDPNVFNYELGVKYSKKKANALAIDKLWEMTGAELIVVLRDNKLTPEEFSKKYEGKFIIEPI